MSLINKVLQDLDQRSAMSSPDGAPPPRQVRAVPQRAGGREWFWRIVATLILVALGWVAWVAYQLQPRPSVATDLAFRAADEAKHKKAATPAQKGGPEKMGTIEPAKPAPQPQAAAPVAKAPAVPQDGFKLALSIDTPIAPRTEAAPAPKAAAAPKPAVLPPSPSAAAKLKPETQLALAAPKLEKRDQARSASDKAEAEFRRGSSLLGQGRVAEAEGALLGALAVDASHEPTRQSLVALYLEQRRIPEASRLLQEGLGVNPANARFAIVLARIHAERGDYSSALDVLNKVKASAAGDAEFNDLSGAVLQRLGRHAEAAEAYRAAVHAVPHNGVSWVGLGISLEALARKPEAAEAFRRAVATGSLTAEVKSYAEQRARALRGS